MNTGFGSIFHDRVTLTSENGFTIQKGDELIKIAGGELVDIYPDSEYMSDGRLKVAPLGLNTTITVLSVERSYGNPYYSGTLEMAAEDGGLVIVNELPLEEYKEISPVFEQDIYEAISMKTCVEKRETYGAPGPKVMEQIIAGNKEYLKNN